MTRPEPIRFHSVEFAWIPATRDKSWSFAEFTDVDGAVGCVEFANGAGDAGRDVIISQALEMFDGAPIADEREIEGLLGLGQGELRAMPDMAGAVSALRTAVVELQCQHDGRAMTEVLGGAQQESVLLYANINRYLRSVLGSRTPEDFGEAAEGAAREGFTVLKVDPFDEVTPTDTVDEMTDTVQTSLARLQAMRSAVGPDVHLQVDCHGSFNLRTAAKIAEELEKLGVDFFEDPLRYAPQTEGLARLYDEVNIPLVAGGSGYGEEYFDDLVKDGRVSITMQDVQRCGGVGVAARAGQAGIKSGVKTSCHSPFGPLSSLASAHVHAAVPDSHALEYALWEAPWRADLVEPRERVEGGRIFLPGGRGLGARLNYKTLEANGGRRWRV